MDPTLQIIFNILLTLVGVLFSFVLGRVFKKLDELQAKDLSTDSKITDLSVKLPTEYVHKTDFTHMIETLFKKLDKIEAKIDNKADKD